MDEKYLIEGLKNKNRVVFDFVFHYYYSGLCAYAEKIIGDTKIVEDIVQDLFVKLWVKNQEISINSNLKSYLFSAVKNRSLDLLKHEKIKKKSLKVLKDKEKSNHFEEFWFAESELSRIIYESIKKLPPRCGEIFKLSRFEGVKNQQIADQLGISKRTVELQISNALKALRKDLKPYLPIFLLSILFP